MKIHMRRIVGIDREVIWVLFWEGRFTRPIAILSQLDVERLVRSVKEQDQAIP